MRRILVITTITLAMVLLVYELLTVTTSAAASTGGEGPTATGVPIPIPSGRFSAALSGGQEVPPVAASGRGSATFQVSKTGVAFELSVFNTANVTQAHIHCGGRRVNGPVVAFLYGPGDPVTPNGTLSQGTLTATDVITRSSSVECPSGVADFDGLVAIIESGDAYVNVHTVANPGGEIRGQIVPNSP